MRSEPAPRWSRTRRRSGADVALGVLQVACSGDRANSHRRSDPCSLLIVRWRRFSRRSQPPARSCSWIFFSDMQHSKVPCPPGDPHGTVASSWQSAMTRISAHGETLRTAQGPADRLRMHWARSSIRGRTPALLWAGRSALTRASTPAPGINSQSGGLRRTSTGARRPG